MYLSRIALDERRRETMRALARPGILHGAIERSFQGDRTRTLWRTDILNNRTYLLIMSHDEPSMAHIAEQFGFKGDAGETKCYSPFISKIEAGQKWRFRLRANPVHSVRDRKDEKHGTIYAHVTQEQQKNWLMKRAERNGFALNADDFDVVHTRWEDFKKHADEKRDVILRTATYEGLLTVTDADKFQKALVEGIGKAKAYGCGLMTISYC